MVGNMGIRACEYQLHKILKSMFDTELDKCSRYSRAVIQFLLFGGALGFFASSYLQITDQKLISIQIASFGYAVVFDLIMFEILRFCFRKYIYIKKPLQVSGWTN